jgi:hypothetical protein
MNLEQRRKVRALEAKRDQLMVAKEKAATELTKTRAELKLVRKQSK